MIEIIQDNSKNGNENQDQIIQEDINKLKEDAKFDQKDAGEPQNKTNFTKLDLDNLASDPSYFNVKSNKSDNEVNSQSISTNIPKSKVAKDSISEENITSTQKNKSVSDESDEDSILLLQRFHSDYNLSQSILPVFGKNLSTTTSLLAFKYTKRQSIHDEFVTLNYLEKEIEKMPKFAQERLNKFVKIIKNFEPVNIKMVKSFQFFGLPDADEAKGIRSLSWKLSLEYLPSEKSKWREFMQTKSNYYREYVNDFIKDDIDSFNEEELKLWETVQRDTERTKADFNFFQQKNRFNEWNNYQCPFKKKRVNSFQTHTDAIQRLLYIYGRLNPIKYVQGMNELMATIYYNFAFDTNEEMLKNVETDTFFCFTIIMSFLYDGFMQDFDNSKYGINQKVKDQNELLQKIDPPLWAELESKQVKPEYYALRWILLLLSYEFQINETSKIWDSLFAHPKPLVFLNYICVSILHYFRGILIGEIDYCETIKVLQNLRDFPQINLPTILSQAYENYLIYEKNAVKLSKFIIF